MTISEGLSATFQLYFAVISFVYILVMIAILFGVALVYLFHEEPEAEQARLTRWGE